MPQSRRRFLMFLTVAAACLGLVASSVPTARPAPPPSNTALPVISGTAQAGQTLRVSTGSWSPPASSYQYAWQRCNSSGSACQTSPTSTSSASYTLTAGDVGSRIVAQVAPDGVWNRAATSLPTAVVAVAPAGPPVNSVRPVISGTTQVGQSLQVSSGTWSPVPSSLLYAWHRCNSAGANCLLSPTSSSTPSYLLTSADVGFTIVAQVAPNGLWGSSVNSAPSAVVTASAPTGTPVNSVRPVISGSAQVGQWLSVSNGTWSPTPTSYAYAWHRCNSAGTSCSLSPSSSNSSSYLVGSGDVGYTIVAQVAPNGLWGSSVNSAPSAVVVGSAPSGSPVNSVRPVISGTAQVGQWLSVSNGLVVADADELCLCVASL